MAKKYYKPTFEIFYFESEDIITVSGAGESGEPSQSITAKVLKKAKHDAGGSNWNDAW